MTIEFLDHVVVHLNPAYRKKLKLSKHVLNTSRGCGEPAGMSELNSLEFIRTFSNTLDEYIDAVTSCISFHEDSHIPFHTRVSYNKVKPWYTSKETRLRLEKELMFWSGNRDSFKV